MEPSVENTSTDSSEVATSDTVNSDVIQAEQPPGEENGERDKDIWIEDSEMLLSRCFKAKEILLGEDRLIASSRLGYRMALSTRGVCEGSWIFEAQILYLGETGAARIGWATRRSGVHVSVGANNHSYGYRNVNGSKLHAAARIPYGEPFKEGDVIGCYINLPQGHKYVPSHREFVVCMNEPHFLNKEPEDNVRVPGSEITFYKNGVCQGKAFSEIYGGIYYPAISMFTSDKQREMATIRVNFGPSFQYFTMKPSSWEDRTFPIPMSEADPPRHIEAKIVEPSVILAQRRRRIPQGAFMRPEDD